MRAHLHDFAPLTEPIRPAIDVVDVRPYQQRCIAEARRGILPWNWRAWRTARTVGLQRANAAALEEKARREQERDRAFEDRLRTWEQLVANDPETVIAMVDAAFDDNEHPAVPLDVDGDRLTIALLVPGADVIPERHSAVTPTGRPSMRKRSQTDRNQLYLELIASHGLATIKEAFAVAPGIATVALLVATNDAFDPIFFGSFSRDSLDAAPAHPSETLLSADGVQVQLKGRTREVAALLPDQLRGLAEVQAALEDAVESAQ